MKILNFIKECFHMWWHVIEYCSIDFRIWSNSVSIGCRISSNIIGIYRNFSNSYPMSPSYLKPKLQIKNLILETNQVLECTETGEEKKSLGNKCCQLFGSPSAVHRRRHPQGSTKGRHPGTAPGWLH